MDADSRTWPAPGQRWRHRLLSPHSGLPLLQLWRRARPARAGDAANRQGSAAELSRCRRRAGPYRRHPCGSCPDPGLCHQARPHPTGQHGCSARIRPSPGPGGDPGVGDRHGTEGLGGSLSSSGGRHADGLVAATDGLFHRQLAGARPAGADGVDGGTRRVAAQCRQPRPARQVRRAAAEARHRHPLCQPHPSRAGPVRRGRQDPLQP